MRRVILMLMICLTVSALAAGLSSCGGAAEDPGKDNTPEEEQAQEGNEQQPEQEENEQEPEQKEPEEAPEENEEETMDIGKALEGITINTQSSIRIEGSKIIYIDPYKRGGKANDADIIFITHSHYDHFDRPSLMNTVTPEALIVCPESMKAEVEALGIGKSVTAVKSGEKLDIADGISVEAVPAYNKSKVFHPKSKGWLGYIITMDGVRYYAAGDTDALPELEDVECDIAMVPVGGTYTMTAAEAADLVNRIKPEYAVPIHYGTIVGRAEDAEIFRSRLENGIRTKIKVEDAK